MQATTQIRSLISDYSDSFDTPVPGVAIIIVQSVCEPIALTRRL